MNRFWVIALLAACLAACAPRAAPRPPDAFTLTSERFNSGRPIPAKYTCQGQNVSPSLAWVHPPQGVKAFALIMDDPDAPSGTFTHWVLYNIPGATASLPDTLPGQGGIAYIGSHGTNSAGNTYYQGPCPPLGTHRYFFKLYALDAMLDFPASPKAADLSAAMAGHILAEAELMGTFTK